MPEPKLPNGNLWKIILIVALTGYIGVKDVVVPLIAEMTSKPSARAQGTIISDDKIIELLQTAAANRTNIEALRTSVLDLKSGLERVERKLDTHIGK